MYPITRVLAGDRTFTVAASSGISYLFISDNHHLHISSKKLLKLICFFNMFFFFIVSCFLNFVLLYFFKNMHFSQLYSYHKRSEPFGNGAYKCFCIVLYCIVLYSIVFYYSFKTDTTFPHNC